MKKSFLLALAAIFVLACSSGSKADPDIPFIKPGSQGGQESGQGQQETSTPKVTTGQAVDITSVGALVENRYTGASKGAYDRGIYYGTSANALDKSIALSSSKAKEGSFRTQLSSLEPETEYYYKAYITVWSDTENKYVDVYGDVKHFTTEAAGNGGGGGQGGGGGTTVTGLQYLGGYEIPAISLENTQSCSASGNETYGNTKWYNYTTTNSNQMVVTHTYAYNSKQYRNYTCLVDKTKKAPLWSAFVMHKGAYPDNNMGRTGSWTVDPGIPASWQQESSGSGYSRGHFVASNYRQANSDANKQTFYNTNQALQEQNGFNGTLWAKLEQDVVSHAPTGRDTLYVVVGILYENSKTIGGVPCPSHFYKCLMKCSFNEAGAMTAAKGCAYLFTNEAHSGNYSQGITSIDAVEQRSGWDFFANVPKNLQDTAEAQSASLW
jgi:DNA/RNA endonuclease G (NUC1)